MTALPALLLALAASSPAAGSPAGAPPVPPDWPTLPPLEGTPEPVTMTLPEALAEATRQNPTLEQARARGREALAVVRQAWAPLLPTLAGNGQFFRNSEDFVLLRPTSATQVEKVYVQPLEAFSGGAALRLPLVVPDAWFALASSRESARAAEASAEAARLGLLAALVQTAWAAWAGEEIVAASERAVAVARDQAESARRQVRAGTAAPLSVLQAETALTRRESDLVQARSERARARIAIGVLLGRPDPVRIPMAPPPRPATLDVSVLSREAAERRPELLAQAAAVRASERQVDAAWWRIAPQLSASGSAFAQSVPYPTGKSEGWRVTVDLTWTLYDGGWRYGKAHQAEAQVDQARAADLQARLQVGQEVQNAAREVEAARQRLALAAKQREPAAEAAASAGRGFREGLSSSLDVLFANDALFGAEVQLADSAARLGGALAALDRAVGRAP
jgi:outer membrane protein TolC